MLLRSAIALVAGLLLALAFEPVGLSWPVPLAVAGYVVSVHGLPARRAWVPGLLFGIAFCYVLMFWMRVIGVDAWLALSGLEAAFYGLLGPAVTVLARLRFAPVWIAIAWTAMEAIRSTWPFGGMPWGRLGYATADTPWESALPYVGMSGLTLLLALLGATLAWVVVRAGTTRLVAAGAAVALLAVTLVPALTPYSADVDGERTVALVQGNVPGDGSDILLDHRQVTRNHVTATEQLAADVAAGERAAPDFVVWPENSTAVDPFLDLGVNDGIRGAVRSIGVPVLVGGIVDAGRDHFLNQGIVWTPEVGPGDRYSKRHPVPFGEYIPWRSIFEDNFGRLRRIPRDMKAGVRSEPLRIADTLVADAICFDVAYDDGIHEQLRNGAELVVVQTSNASFIHTAQIDQQFEITRLRALETGRHVVVASTNGVSGVITPDGTVLDTAAPRTQEVLLETVGLSTELTPAVRIGPWLGRGCVAVTALALVSGLLGYRRRQVQQRQSGGGERQ